MTAASRARLAPLAAPLLALLVALPAAAQARPGAPTGLLVELLRWPEDAVITDATPEFSWIVSDPRRGAVQSAYEIVVASSPELLDPERADAWASGRVESDSSVDVEYRGTPLRSNTSYWWRVRTWDAGGEAGPFSAPQRFRTGDLSEQGRAFPDESRWVQLTGGEWVLENRQRARYREVQPVSTLVRGPGHVFVDFGRAAFGTLRLRLTAATTGDSAIVYLGERATDGLAVHKNPGRSNIGFQRVVLPLEAGAHTYTVHLPRHVSHYPHSQVVPEHMEEVTPFRYAEIVGPSTAFVADRIVQLALFHPYEPEASGFQSSSENLDRVWELSRYTLLATPFLSMYLDGNRERMPYEADSYIQQLGHYAVDREFATARYTLEFLLAHASWPTEWQMHTVFMAWADYLATGNTELIREHYAELRRKTLLDLTDENGLISTRTGKATPAFQKSLNYEGSQFGDIVDWPPGSPATGSETGSFRGTTVEGERDGYVFMPYNTVVNAFHYRALVLMSRMAAAVGEREDARALAQRAERVRAAFNRLLFDAERGVYVDGIGTDHASLHANMFPLAFGLVAPEHEESVVRFIESRGMAASVYGAQYLLEGLYDAGADEYALSRMTSEGKRSWMNMLKVGSTMTTEAWDEEYKPNLTWNHAWGSAPANIVARKLMGVEPLEPAYRTVRIHPRPGGLDYFWIQLPTVRGGIAARWQARDGRYTFDVLVPANTTAEMWLPGDPADLVESGRRIADRTDVSVVRREPGVTVVRLGGGTYYFDGVMPAPGSR